MMQVSLRNNMADDYENGRKRGQALRRSSGQAMVEYLFTAAALILAVVVIAVFLYTFREHSGRVLDLVASKDP